MARRRFFVDEVRNGRADIVGDEAHHLTRVLRVEVGQKFEITDTRRLWLATVDAARKDLVRFVVEEELAAGPELPPVTLLLALIKFEKFEWAVEKATELGVTRIVPFEAGRSEKGLLEGSRKRLERWRRIAREASEQSRRMSAPEIAEAVKFAAALGTEAPRRVWLDEKPGAPALMRVLLDGAAGRISGVTVLMIGPEGGWTDAERDALSAAGWSAASLGPLVLRAETAVCAALAVAGQAWIAGENCQ